MAQVKRRSQHKRKPRLGQAFGRYLRESADYHNRLEAWRKILANPPQDVRERIADLLARLGYMPDLWGFPVGKWPELPKCHPLAILDGLTAYEGDNVHDTLAWKANVLEVASLLWAGAIRLDELETEYPDYASLGISGDAIAISVVMDSDLKSFWGRPGVGLLAEDIRAKWQSGKRLVNQFTLADMLRHFKGGT